MTALAIRVFGFIAAAVLFLGYWEDIARVAVNIVFFFVTEETLDDPLWVIWKHIFTGAALLVAIGVGSVPVLVAECFARICTTRARRRWERVRDREVELRDDFNRLRWEFQRFLRNRR